MFQLNLPFAFFLNFGFAFVYVPNCDVNTAFLCGRGVLVRYRSSVCLPDIIRGSLPGCHPSKVLGWSSISKLVHGGEKCE